MPNNLTIRTLNFERQLQKIIIFDVMLYKFVELCYMSLRTKNSW